MGLLGGFGMCTRTLRPKPRTAVAIALLAALQVHANVSRLQTGLQKLTKTRADVKMLVEAAEKKAQEVDVKMQEASANGRNRCLLSRECVHPQLAVPLCGSMLAACQLCLSRGGESLALPPGSARERGGGRREDGGGSGE